MDKETIFSYLVEIKQLMFDGKFITAYNKLKFVLDNFDDANDKQGESK